MEYDDADLSFIQAAMGDGMLGITDVHEVWVRPLWQFVVRLQTDQHYQTGDPLPTHESVRDVVVKMLNAALEF